MNVYLWNTRIVISDAAQNLNSATIMNTLEGLGINKMYTSPYHSKSNGIIERVFRTIKDMLYSTIKTYGLDWIDALPIVEIGLRSA